MDHSGCMKLEMWSLVIDKLLIDLDSQGYEVFGFLDETVIMVRGNVDSVLSMRITVVRKQT
jgi:hypothetical protein